MILILPTAACRNTIAVIAGLTEVLLMEGVELALKKRGYPALADMKAKWQRKER
jgi:hypothetical protein